MFLRKETTACTFLNTGKEKEEGEREKKKAQNKRWKSRHNNYNQLKGQNILFERSEK